MTSLGAAGRPKKVRYIQRMPQVIQFSPRGKPGRPEEVELGLDQFEALKLADFQGFSQDQGALAMHISRASFGRILRGARKKVADVIINGKILKIRMGNVQVGVRKSDVTRDSLVSELTRFQEKAKQVFQVMKENSSKLPSLNKASLPVNKRVGKVSGISVREGVTA